MKAVLAVALALALVAAGWSWRERSAALATAAAAGARADSLYEVTIEQDQALEAINTQENGLITVLTTERDSAVARADRAEFRRPKIIDRVAAAAGPDSAVVRAAVQEVVDSIDATEIRPLRRALSAADSIGAARARQLEATETALTAVRMALAASRAEADAWEKAAKPSLFGLHVSPAVAAALGLGTGILISLR